MRKNNLLVFNLIDDTSTVIESRKRVSFNCYIENIDISATNTGSGNNTSISLKKFSNGVDSTLFSGIMIESGKTYFNRRRVKIGKIDANRGDILYFSMDTVGSSVINLNIQLILNDRDKI